MYVRMYDDLIKGADDAPTIGVLLCTDTDNTIARYSVLHDNNQLFAAKYMTYMPTEEELRNEIEQQNVSLWSSMVLVIYKNSSFASLAPHAL